MRFSKSSLERLDEIMRHNFRENPNVEVQNTDNDEANNQTSSEPKKRFNNFTPARALDPWAAKSNGRKLPTGSLVYGIAHRDVNLLITSPRTADEEFEMESRKGPIVEREKPTRSVLINGK